MIMKLFFFKYAIVCLIVLSSCQNNTSTFDASETEKELQLMLIEEGKAGEVKIGMFISEIALPPAQSITQHIIYYDDESYRIDWIVNEGSNELLRIIQEYDTVEHADEAIVKSIIVLSEQFQTKEKLKVGSTFKHILSAIEDVIVVYSTYDEQVFCYSEQNNNIHFILETNALIELHLIGNAKNGIIEIDKDYVRTDSKVERIRVF